MMKTWSEDLEEVNGIKLTINKHKYELIYLLVNLKRFIKVPHRRRAHFSSVYIFQVGK